MGHDYQEMELIIRNWRVSMQRKEQKGPKTLLIRNYLEDKKHLGHQKSWKQGRSFKKEELVAEFLGKS